MARSKPSDAATLEIMRFTREGEDFAESSPWYLSTVGANLNARVAEALKPRYKWDEPLIDKHASAEAFRAGFYRVSEAIRLAHDSNRYTFKPERRPGEGRPEYDYLIFDKGEMIGRWTPSGTKRNGYYLKDRVGVRVFYIYDPAREWDKTNVTAKTKGAFLARLVRYRDRIRSLKQIGDDAAEAARKKAERLAASRVDARKRAIEKHALDSFAMLQRIAERKGVRMPAETENDLHVHIGEVLDEIAGYVASVDAEEAA